AAAGAGGWGFLYVVEPRDQVGERRLPRPGLPHDRRRRPGRDVDVDPVEDRLLAIAEVDALEGDVAAHGAGVELDRPLVLVDVDLEVEVLEDAVEERERRLHVD